MIENQPHVKCYCIFLQFKLDNYQLSQVMTQGLVLWSTYHFKSPNALSILLEKLM